ncbi:MAG: aldehyde dehydrogenase family protein [Actinobacteria bacterium]|nr:aldehyde dehydrogenase family protein [Actinomycetota bacterium]
MNVIRRENPTFPDRIVGEVYETSVADVDAIVQRSDEAFRVWSRLSLDQRCQELAAAADLVTPELYDEIAALMCAEVGKPLPDSRGEAMYSVSLLRFNIDQAAKVLATHVIDDAAGKLVRTRVPFGVVLAITPWNAPIVLSMLKVAPALVAGNSIIVKPSPQAPLAVTKLLEAIASGLPHGLLQVVHGGPEAGDAFVTHPLVRKIAFTGGDVVARHIGVSAARMITPTVMELGGNDAAIFLEDAVLDEAALDRIALATFMMGGQVCMASKRIYVHRSRYDEFVAGFVAACERSVIVGDPMMEGVTVGPVVSRAAQERLEKLVADSITAGGQVIDVGTITDEAVVAGGYFVRPRVVLNLPDDAQLVCEEQFGPLVPIQAYDDIEEVIARANATELGLAGSVWSADEDRAFEVAQRIESGYVFINTHNRTGMTPRAPFGGVKKSGFGREYGDEGLLDYTQNVSIHAAAAYRPGGSGGSANAYPGTS